MGGILGLPRGPRPQGQVEPDLVGHLPRVGHHVHPQLHPPAEGLLAHGAREDLAVWGASRAGVRGGLCLRRRPLPGLPLAAGRSLPEEGAARVGEGDT